MGANNAQNL